MVLGGSGVEMSTLIPTSRPRTGDGRVARAQRWQLLLLGKVQGDQLQARPAGREPTSPGQTCTVWIRGPESLGQAPRHAPAPEARAQT